MSTILINHLANFLNQYKFDKTAEFIKACRRLGTDAPRARKDETGIFDALRGLTHTVTDRGSFFKLWNSLSMVNKFGNDAAAYEEWIRDVQWPAPKIIAELVSASPLRGERLRILDIGCYDGEQFRVLLEHPILGENVEAYTGVDLSSSAIAKAREKVPAHKNIDCRFIQGNALERELYDGIPHNNNLIICSGVCNYLTPAEIKILLEYSAKKLSDNGRIYFSYHTILPIYNEVPTLASNLFGEFKRYFKDTKEETEEGVKYYRMKAFDRKRNFYYAYAYNPPEFEKIANNCGLKILAGNSKSSLAKITKRTRLHAHDHVCLVKRESLVTASFPAASPIAQQLA